MWNSDVFFTHKKHMGSIVLTLFSLSVHVFILWPMFACCFSVQLLGGCSDESWSQWPFDERPHVCRAVPGQAQAVCFPAAGPPQPAQQESATPLDDAARARHPLVLYSKCGRRRGTNLEPFFLLGMFYWTERQGQVQSSLSFWSSWTRCAAGKWKTRSSG